MAGGIHHGNTATTQDLAGPSLSHPVMACALVVLSRLCSKLFIRQFI